MKNVNDLFFSIPLSHLSSSFAIINFILLLSSISNDYCEIRTFILLLKYLLCQRCLIKGQMVFILIKILKVQCYRKIIQ